MATPTPAYTSSLDAELLRTLNNLKKVAEAAAPVVTPTVATVVTATINRFGAASRKFTEVFGISNLIGKIDHDLPSFTPEDWHESVRVFIPKVDDAYVFPVPQTELTTMGLINGDKALVFGPKGSGKSSLLEQICARLCIPYIRVNGRRDMESSALFGQPTFNPAAGVSYVHGPAGVLAMHGGLLCVDEISAMPAGIAMSMQFMLEDGGKVYLPDLHTDNPSDRYITPHRFFMVGATDNTQLQGDSTGSYVGTNVQNSALVDRFGTVVELDYIGKAHELAMLAGKVPEIDEGTRLTIVDVAQQVRVAHDKGTMTFTMSPRAVLSWARKVAFWGDLVAAFRVSFYNKLTDDDRKQMVEIFKRVTTIDLNKV